MNQKWTAILLAGVTTLSLAGCSGSKANDASTTPPPATSAQGAPDPELQQLMQDQRSDTQELDRLTRQNDQDLGLQVPAPPAQQGGGSQQNGGGGQGRRGNAGQVGGGQGGGGQYMAQAKDLLKQEEQPRKDLIAKLTTFESLAKQAADTKNEKALADAKDQFAALADLLPGQRGFRRGGAQGDGQNGAGQNGGGNGQRNMQQGLEARLTAYKDAGAKLDAANAQLKADLGAKS